MKWLHERINTDSNWAMVRESFSQYYMYPLVWCHRVFEDENSIYLYTSNKYFHAKNENVMKSIDKPIILIEAKNMGNASIVSDTVTRLLASVFFLSVNVRVIMTSNILQYHSLLYRSTRDVCNIV